VVRIRRLLLKTAPVCGIRQLLLKLLRPACELPRHPWGAESILILAARWPRDTCDGALFLRASLINLRRTWTPANSNRARIRHSGVESETHCPNRKTPAGRQNAFGRMHLKAWREPRNLSSLSPPLRPAPLASHNELDSIIGFYSAFKKSDVAQALKVTLM